MSRSVIREAIAPDKEKLLVLMKELSKELQCTSFQVTLKDLDSDVFGKTPSCTVYVSQNEGGDLTGYVLFYSSYTSLEGRVLSVEEIFVMPSERRKGIGSSLYRKAAQIALERGCKVCDIVSSQEDKFLLSQGAFDLTVDENVLYFAMNHSVMEEFVQRCKNVGGVEIRKSAKGDYEGIQKLIHGLNTYENKADTWLIDPETLEKDGPQNEAFYDCFVAEANGSLVGYTIFFYTYSGNGSGVYMEDLFVSEEYRKKGLGKALWGSVIKAGLSNGGRRCNFGCLTYNTPTIGFYKHMGAIDMTEEKGLHFYRMNKETMESYVNNAP